MLDIPLSKKAEQDNAAKLAEARDAAIARLKAAKGKIERGDMLKAVGVGAPLAFVAALLARRAAGGVRRDKTGEKIDRAVSNATPVASFDPFINDTETERQERAMGLMKLSEEIMPLHKKANGLKELMGYLRKGFDGFQKTIAPTGAGDASKSILYPTVATAAALGGGALGWKLADKQVADKDKEELDEESAQLENLLDAVRFEAIRKQWGGMPKAAGETVPKQAEASHALSSLYVGYSVLVAALAHNAMKRHYNKNDPNRKKAKKLATLLMNQARFDSGSVELLPPAMPMLGGSSKSKDKNTAAAAAAGTVPIEV